MTTWLEIASKWLLPNSELTKLRVVGEMALDLFWMRSSSELFAEPLITFPTNFWGRYSTKPWYRSTTMSLEASKHILTKATARELDDFKKCISKRIKSGYWKFRHQIPAIIPAGNAAVNELTFNVQSHVMVLACALKFKLAPISAAFARQNPTLALSILRVRVARQPPSSSLAKIHRLHMDTTTYHSRWPKCKKRPTRTGQWLWRGLRLETSPRYVSFFCFCLLTWMFILLRIQPPPTTAYDDDRTMTDTKKGPRVVVDISWAFSKILFPFLFTL